MPQLNQIATRVLNKPLLLEAGYAQIFIASIADKLGVSTLINAEGEQFSGEQLVTLASSYLRADSDDNKPYQVVDGMAVIPVVGTLVNKSGYLRPMSGMTGYDGIRASIDFAINDPDVTGIMLDMNTPGGEVAGCFDLCDYIAEKREIKPIWAFANEMNASAGQAIAAACSRRLITQTAIAGSIGVIRGHVSYEKQLEESGRKVTLIIAGKHKADGNPYQDLPADVLSRFEEEVLELRELFASKVALYTGMSLDAVKATEALCYTGQAAIDIGLADQMVRSDQALTIFSQYLASRQNPHLTAIGANMPNHQTQQETISQADHASAVATAQQQAATDATAAERARIGAIMNSEEAKGRENLAGYFAYDTNMTAEDAQKALAKAPIAAAAPQEESDPLTAAMGQTEQPNIGADGADSTSAAADLDLNACLNLAQGIK